MKSFAATIWNPWEIELFNNILMQIIPANKARGIPSAAELGMVNYITQKIKDNSKLQILFTQGLKDFEDLLANYEKFLQELTNKDWITLVLQLEERHFEFFEVLLRNTYEGYYSESKIRPFFGLSLEPTQPEGYLVSPDDPTGLDRMLEPVRQKNICYRVC
jgi:hypothetical protein